MNPVTPVPPTQRITRFIDDIRPSPGSNVQRIYGLSDCVIAVAFTLFVVNIHLPPDGLSESQLQSFIAHDILSDIPFYLISYIVVPLPRLHLFEAVQQPLHHVERGVPGIDRFSPRPCCVFLQLRQPGGVWQVFASTQVVTSTTLLLMWVVARVDHLLDSEVPSEYLRYTTARLFVIPLGTLLSIGILQLASYPLVFFFLPMAHTPNCR